VIDDAWLYEQWVVQHRTMRDIAAELAISRSTIRRAVRTHGLKRESALCDIDAAWLHEQYILNNRTARDIGLEVGMSVSAIRKRIEKHNLSRGGQSPDEIDRDWLRTQYVVKRRGLEEIADEIGVSTTTVFRAVARYELRRTFRRQGPLGLSDPDWLRGRYIGDGATVTDIANELGVSTASVRHALRRHRITRN
jgi:DNA-binding CsgD family transcriptional regulator